MGIPTLISTNSDPTDVASIEFTSGIDSTYDEYMFVCTDIGPATDTANFLFQCSIDGGSNYNVTTTSTNWMAYNEEGGGSAGISYRTGEDQAQGTAFQHLTLTTGNGADESCAGILHLFSPASTTYVKHFYARFNNYYSGNELYSNHIAGYFNDANDINAIQFKMSSGNFDGVIQMYGIK